MLRLIDIIVYYELRGGNNGYTWLYRYVDGVGGDLEPWEGDVICMVGFPATSMFNDGRGLCVWATGRLWEMERKV